MMRGFASHQYRRHKKLMYGGQDVSTQFSIEDVRGVPDSETRVNVNTCKYKMKTPKSKKNCLPVMETNE